MIDFFCVHCGSKVNSQTQEPGQKIACPNCKVELIVPSQKKKIANPFELTAENSNPEPTLGSKLKWFLAASLIGCFAISALAGIMALFSSRIGQFQIKILLTAVSLGAYSLTGLCSSVLIEKPQFKMYARLGITLSAIGAAFAVLTTWEFIQGWETVLKGRAVFIVLAVAHAHASLLLMIDTKNNAIKTLRVMVLSTIVLLAAMLIAATFGMTSNVLIWRIVPTAIIIDVFGTLTIPVLHFATRTQSRNDNLATNP